MRHIAEHYKLSKDARILDVGCAKGFMLLIVGFDVRSIDTYSELYTSCYADAFGRIGRTVEYWKWLNEKIKLQDDLKFMSLIMNDRVVGYYIACDKVLCEFSLNFNELSLSELLRVISRDGNFIDESKLEFHVSPDYTILCNQNDLNTTISYRCCTFGGHMVKILSTKNVAKLMCERLSAVYREWGVKPFSKDSRGIKYSWNGTAFLVDFDMSDLGVLNYETTCMLEVVPKNRTVC